MDWLMRPREAFPEERSSAPGAGVTMARDASAAAPAAFSSIARRLTRFDFFFMVPLYHERRIRNSPHFPHENGGCPDIMRTGLGSALAATTPRHSCGGNCDVQPPWFLERCSGCGWWIRNGRRTAPEPHPDLRTQSGSGGS